MSKIEKDVKTLLSETFSDALCRAYLEARRRKPTGMIQVPIVRNDAGRAVDFGDPCSWQPGTAALVLSQLYTIEFYTYNNDIVAQGQSSLRHTPSASSLVVDSTTPDTDETDLRFMQGLAFGVSCEIGKSSKMEDECVVVNEYHHLLNESVPDSQRVGHQAFCAIFDGHGGNEIAQYCQRNLHLNIAKECHDKQDLETAIRQGVFRTEEEVLEIARTKLRKKQLTGLQGSTAALLIFSGRQLFIGHTGDSRAVLSRDGETILLTTDHRANTSFSEKTRIEQEGGFVDSGGLTNGDISVSRALGDLDPDTGVKLKGLSAVPTIGKQYLTDDDEFVIIACDGIWDYVDSAVAVDIVRQSLKEFNDAQKASEDLVKMALSKGSDDNLSVILISLKQFPSKTGRFTDTGRSRARTSSMMLPRPSFSTTAAPVGTASSAASTPLPALLNGSKPVSHSSSVPAPIPSSPAPPVTTTDEKTSAPGPAPARTRPKFNFSGLSGLLKSPEPNGLTRLNSRLSVVDSTSQSSAPDKPV